jgi:hypothetical protein
MQSARFYHNLREKAKVVDYGSHNVFEDKANQRLLEKKKEEWRRERELQELNDKVREMEDISRAVKSNIEYQYRD